MSALLPSEEQVNTGLELNDVSLTLDDKQIIDKLSFHANEGQIVCLVGPSGCGKTTTLRILAGLESPDSGTVSLRNRMVYSAGINTPPEKRKVGFLFQDYALFPHLNVKKNIQFGISDRENRDKIAQEMLATVSMSEYADAMPHMLSGGQQQRIALARALATEPDVMLLDEPFSGLDTALRMKLRANTYAILKKNNITTIMVTHDPDEAMFMADLIVLMNDGKIIQVGSPVEIYNQPKTEFCAEFFGELCAFNGTVNNGKLTTDIGTFDAGQLAQGQLARVLVRPESLKVMPGHDNDVAEKTLFELSSVHFLGEKQLITLRHPDNASDSNPVILKTSLDEDIPVGARVALSAEQHDLLFIQPLN